MNKSKKKRTEILIETHEITVIRKYDKQSWASCDRCQTAVAVFTLERFAALMQTSCGEVRRRIQAGELHFTQNGSVSSLVCGNSLGEQ